MASPPENLESPGANAPVIGYFVPARARDVRDDVALWELWHRVWRGRFIVFATTFVCAVAFIVWAQYSTRIYQAAALVSIVRPDGGTEPNIGLGGQLGALAAAAGLRTGSGAVNREEFIAFLQSRRLQGKFIEIHGLLQILYSDRWDARAKAWRSQDVDYVPSFDEAIERLRKGVLTVAVDKATGLVSVKFEWKDARLAAQWANAYVELANKELRERTRIEADRSLEFLNRELAGTPPVPIQQAIFGLIQQQMNSKMLASVRQEYAYRTIDTATEPDHRRFVRPRRMVYAAVGAFLGMLIGAAFCVWRYRPRPLQ